MPVPARLRKDIKAAYAHSDALLEEERFAQAAEVLGEVIEPAALAFSSESRQVLALRRRRAAIRLLGGDYRAALPEFDALADAYARIAGPTGEQARACRAQAARCRAELGQVTDALAALQGVLNVVRAVDSDVSEEAVELRHNIGMLLLAQGRAAEARQVLEPLHEGMCMVFGPDDETTVEIAEALEKIHSAVGEVRHGLRPGGAFVYTVRHAGDAHYGAGVAHGDDIFEHGGFAVHFFSRALVEALAEGWLLAEVHPFEEGELPRRLWRVTQVVPR